MPLISTHLYWELRMHGLPQGALNTLQNVPLKCCWRLLNSVHQHQNHCISNHWVPNNPLPVCRSRASATLHSYLAPCLEHGYPCRETYEYRCHHPMKFSHIVQWLLYTVHQVFTSAHFRSLALYNTICDTLVTIKRLALSQEKFPSTLSRAFPMPQLQDWAYITSNF